MPIMIEEVIKANKDKVFEQQYKNVRQALRLQLSRYIAEEPNGILEKSIESFVGKLNRDEDVIEEDNQVPYDINIAANLGGAKIYTLPSQKKASDIVVLDQLLKMSDDMCLIFDGFEKFEGGQLLHKISTVGIVNLYNFTESIKNAKLNCFPRHVERVSFGLSEEQEIKAIVPKSTFKTIKLMIDKYYYVFRIISINQIAKIAFQKISIYRDNLHIFEYSIYYYLSKLRNSDLSNAVIIGSYTREIKSMLLYYKKFVEAMYESDFGKLVNALTGMTQEAGMRIFIRYNKQIDVVSVITKTNKQVDISYSLTQFDEAMKPILKLTDCLDFSRNPKLSNTNVDKQKAFREISEMIDDFKMKINKVINEFLKIIPQSNNDFTYFIHTIQSFIIPYITQQKGVINETFVIGIRNVNIFYWKLMLKIIERSLTKDLQFSDILGLQTRVLDGDMIAYKKDIKKRTTLKLKNQMTTESKLKS